MISDAYAQRFLSYVKANRDVRILRILDKPF